MLRPYLIKPYPRGMGVINLAKKALLDTWTFPSLTLMFSNTNKWIRKLPTDDIFLCKLLIITNNEFHAMVPNMSPCVNLTLLTVWNKQTTAKQLSLFPGISTCQVFHLLFNSNICISLKGFYSFQRFKISDGCKVTWNSPVKVNRL